MLIDQPLQTHLLPLISALATTSLSDAAPVLQLWSELLGPSASWQLLPGTAGTWVSLDDPVTIRHWVERSDQHGNFLAMDGVPLRIGDAVVGALHAPQARPALAELAASLLAGALERWRAMTLLARAQAEKQLLVTLGQLTAAHTDLRALLHITHNILCTVLPVDAFAGTIYNPHSQAHVLSLLIDGDDVLDDTLVGPLAPNMAGWIIEHREPLRFDDGPVEMGRYPSIQATYYGTGAMRSWLGVPMLVGDRPVGMLAIQHHQAAMYTAHDQQFMREVATQVALAVDKATVLQQGDQVISTLAAQVDLAETLGQVHDVDAALAGAVLAIERAFPNQMYTLMLIDGARRIMGEWIKENNQLFRDGRVGQPVAVDDLMDRVTTTQRPLLIHDDAEWRAHGLGDALVGDLSLPTTESVMGAPLVASDGTILGGISVQAYGRYAFDQAQLGLLASMAHHIALSLENARLIEGRQGQVRALEAAYAQLKLTQSQLMEAERRRAIGDIAAGVAHNFNNLLGTILGAAQLIAFAPTLTAARSEADVIELAARDASVIVRRIQEFTKTRLPVAHASIDVAELVRGAIELTRPRWRDEAQLRGITIDVIVALEPLPPIQGVAAELREVLVNIIGNAVDAMPQGGQLRLSNAQQGEMLVLQVTDTGIGMSPDVLAHVGEPFFTTKGGAGSGLGLAVSQAVVRRHGGALKVASGPDGTTIAITLPLAKTLPVVERAHARHTNVHGNVLLVEDDEALRAVLARTLTCAGHTVSVAASGPAALAHLQTICFDLVITDLGLPSLSGWDVALACHTLCPDVPVLVITGWGDRVGPDEVARRQVAGVLAKPIEQQTLLDTVDRLIGRLKAEG